jgi:hypothetical protein
LGATGRMSDCWRADVCRSSCCLDVGGELLLPMCGVALVSGAGGGVQSQTLYLPASYALIFE